MWEPLSLERVRWRRPHHWVLNEFDGGDLITESWMRLERVWDQIGVWQIGGDEILRLERVWVWEWFRRGWREKDIKKMMMMNLGTPNAGSGPQSRVLPRLLLWLILFVIVTYIVYIFRLVSTSCACDHKPFSNPHHQISSTFKATVSTSSASTASSQSPQSVLDQDQAVEVHC